MSKTLAILLAGVGFVIVSGCSDGPEDMPEVGDVEGVITMDGKPLVGVTVEFTPESGRPSHSVTDSEGRYALKYIKNTMGAKVGHHDVRIMWLENGGEDPDAPPLPQAGQRVKIPERYNKNTTLDSTVVAGHNEFDFDLDSDES